MTIIRLADGGLWIASPVRSTKPELDAVTALGPVRHLLAPTPRHHWRLESWSTLFPDAQLWSCALGPATLGRRSLPARRLGEVPPAEWSGEIDQILFRGIGFQEVTFFHRASRTLLVEDIIQCHDLHRGAPLANAAIRIGGIVSPGGVPRDIRALAFPRRHAESWLETVLSWDFDRLVMAHGPVIESDAKPFVEQAFAWLR